MDNYITRTGKKIVISELDDSQLLKLYRYYRDFCKEINKLLKLESVKKSKDFLEYSEKIKSIKEAMKIEIKHRDLLIGK